jgi:hypothetical protein
MIKTILIVTIIFAIVIFFVKLMYLARRIYLKWHTTKINEKY